MSEEIHVERIGERSAGKPVVEARPQQTPNSSLSPVSIPYFERKWIDVEPGTFDQHFLDVSKLMIRLLRHDDSVNREEDGAVKCEDLASIFRSRITSSSHWSIRTWLSFLQRGGGIKKRFQYCSNSRPIWRYTYWTTLQDRVLLPSDFAEHIYHVGSSHDSHSIVQSGFIPGGKMSRKGCRRCSLRP